MSGFFIAWLGVLCIIALVWLTRHLEISRAQRRERLLGSDSYAGPPDGAPRVSVLVAAKDEEENIEPCVASFCEQDYPDFEVVVIDDRSTDQTPAILRGLQSRFEGKLRVVTVKRLRAGWFGKNNAMREGVAVARGQWLCFADADCRQTSRRTLSMAMSEAVTQGTDFLSVLPVLETRTFWERIIQPVCAAVMVFWYRPEQVNDPKSSAAYANGAFMLIRREVHQAIGGHEGVRTEVNEDMHLARLAKESGFRLQVIQNDDLYVTRMYSTLRQSWRGWSRIFYGCLGTLRRLLLATVILTTFSILPWLSLVTAVIMMVAGGADTALRWPVVAGASLAAVLLQQSVMVRFYRLVRAGAWWSLGYILGAALCWGMLVAAMLKVHGTTRTTWRGTTYRGDRVEPAADILPSERPAGPPAEELGVKTS